MKGLLYSRYIRSINCRIYVLRINEYRGAGRCTNNTIMRKFGNARTEISWLWCGGAYYTLGYTLYDIQECWEGCTGRENRESPNTNRHREVMDVPLLVQLQPLLVQLLEVFIRKH